MKLTVTLEFESRGDVKPFLESIIQANRAYFERTIDTWGHHELNRFYRQIKEQFEAQLPGLATEIIPHPYAQCTNVTISKSAK